MSYSQAGQDKWVLSLFPKGTYLEIGASHPKNINNTYLLELNGWDGLSIDIDNQCEAEWKATRKNRLLIANALAYPFSLLDPVEYLQIDIDPAHQSLLCLRKILASGMEFKCLTFEHDHYTGEGCKEQSRQLLHDAGYNLAVADVLYDGKSFEDWWVKKNNG